MNNNSKNKKNDRQNLYVTVIVILMMVSVIIAIATSLARNTGEVEKSTEEAGQTDNIHNPDGEKKDKDTESSLETEDVFLNEDEEKTEVTTAPEKTDGKETANTDSESADTQSTSAKDRLPLFVAPVSGEVLRSCSLEVPVFSQTMEDYRTHSGVDLYCSAGADVAAVADGIVKRVWDDPMMGMSVSVEHSGGAISVYQNLYDELPDGIKEGTAVRSGQIIATAGNTALLEIAEEDHLHFSLSINGNTVDPSEYIEFNTDPTHEE